MYVAAVALGVPVEADGAADHTVDGAAGERQALRVHGAVDDVRRHRHAGVPEGAERCEVGAVELLQGRVHHRQLHVAVGHGPAVSRDMLDHRRDTARQQAVDGRAAELGDELRIGAKGAIANDGVGLGIADVDAGRAVGVQSDADQLVRQQLVVQPDRLTRRLRVALVQRPKLLGWPAAQGHGWLQPLHPPAFLVDKDQGAGIIDRFAQLVRQSASLVGGLHVAGEQDETPGPSVPEEVALLRRQAGSRASQDAGAAHRTMHPPGRLPQKLCAAARSGKPVTIAR